MDTTRGQGATRAAARVLWILWATYGAFYFCRTNISAALPGLQAEFHFSKTEIGTILGSLKLFYGLGQFLNGQLAERFPARVLLAVGMFTSAALNVVFGLSTALYFFLFVWAANGYFQALGWTPTMKVASRWFDPARRGRAIGFIGTGYQLAGAITFVVAGWSAEYLGWRGAMYVPAALLAAMGLVTLFLLEEAPRDQLDPTAADRERADGAAPGWRHTLAVTLANPRLWLVALALAAVDACRYGFTDWGLSHIMEMQGGGLGKNALKYAILPLGGIPGAFLAGWVSDRLGGRRVPVLVALCVLLAGLAWAYGATVSSHPALSVVMLAFIGFCIFGPQVLLVGSAAIDLARAGRTAAAVGFVNLFGYLGAFAGDQVTGYLADRHGWQAAIHFWAGCALVAALVISPLWRYSAASSRAAARS
ncbi:MAG TPA: MFS transporter [Kofleriaceae bacterium]|nr:MFS transporter [Kofleriaceae bacterium]